MDTTECFESGQWIWSGAEDQRNDYREFSH